MADQRVKWRRGEIGGWERRDGVVIGGDLWTREAERVIKGRGDIHIGGNHLGEESLFPAARVGIHRHIKSGFRLRVLRDNGGRE